jgi:hypothetical protein
MGLMLVAIVVGTMLTVVGLFLAAFATHGPDFAEVLAIILVPWGLVVRLVTGRDIGDPVIYRIFWILQLGYYYVILRLLRRIRAR